MAILAVALPSDLDEVGIRAGRLRSTCRRTATRLRRLICFWRLIVVRRAPIASVARGPIAGAEGGNEGKEGNEG